MNQIDYLKEALHRLTLMQKEYENLLEPSISLEKILQNIQEEIEKEEHNG